MTTLTKDDCATLSDIAAGLRAGTLGPVPSAHDELDHRTVGELCSRVTLGGLRPRWPNAAPVARAHAEDALGTGVKRG